MKTWWRKFRNHMVEKYLLPKYDKPFVIEHHYYDIVKVQKQIDLPFINQQLMRFEEVVKRTKMDMAIMIAGELHNKNIIQFDLVPKQYGSGYQLTAKLYVSIPKR